MARFAKVFAAAIITIALVGCGEESNNVKQFKQDQAGTVTPNGPIDMESVQATPNGVSYNTKDGTSFSVSESKAADGSTRYDQPVRKNP